MRRAIAIIAIIVTAVLLQSTVFSQLQLLGVRPELLYLVTILIALNEGPSEGAIVGFTCGLAQDMFLDQPMGITALTLTLLGYAVGMARQYIVSPSPLVPRSWWLSRPRWGSVSTRSSHTCWGSSMRASRTL
jgi:rod shape-determining protein MreD